ncbi:MAG: rhodanese-like domain-containing protein [Meiothermus sp.]|nr:rhodanese-like domain-containing protein [Meiothermus sp.]
MTQTYLNLSPQQANVGWLPNTLLVDVREDYEYASGHLPKAVNLPLSRFAEEGRKLPKDRPILLVCASGGRSAQAAEYLLSLGFDPARVGNLEGGTFGWMMAGFEVEA